MISTKAIPPEVFKPQGGWLRLAQIHSSQYKEFVFARYGGAEGNRTPVRKQLGRNCSGCSLLFTFPHPGGNKHPTGISSFMMHGIRKA